MFNEKIPYFKIDKFILWGNQNVTSGALNLAFEKGIDIIFLTSFGKFKGKIEGKKSKNIYLRLAQYELWREENCKLKIAKEVIYGKIKNQIALLKYYNIKIEVKNIIDRITCVSNIKELMGIEGIISKIYFSKLGSVITNKEFEFNGRNRRPPKDEINALLSLTYSLTLNYIIVGLEKVGLDTYLGFLHSIKYGREALALDILEEFRQGFCDKFVIKILNRREFKKSDFTENEEVGYRLTDSAFRKYLKKFNIEIEKINEIIDNQASKLKDAILLNKPYYTYEPYKKNN